MARDPNQNQAAAPRRHRGPQGLGKNGASTFEQGAHVSKSFGAVEEEALLMQWFEEAILLIRAEQLESYKTLDHPHFPMPARKKPASAKKSAKKPAKRKSAAKKSTSRSRKKKNPATDPSPLPESPNFGEKSAFQAHGFEAVVRSLEEEIRELYTADEVPWIIGYSGGKDSTAVLQLVWSAIEALPPERRHKPIHVISTDTMVENPVVST
jgi:hypothetical protein